MLAASLSLCLSGLSAELLKESFNSLCESGHCGDLLLSH